jgi:hypothetical protein
MRRKKVAMSGQGRWGQGVLTAGDREIFLLRQPAWFMFRVAVSGYKEEQPVCK